MNRLEQSTPSDGSARLSRKNTQSLARLTAPILIAGFALSLPAASPVLGKAKSQAAATGDSAIEPEAMAGLNKMGTYLRTLKAFQVQAEITTDDVLDSGQLIESSKKVDVVAVSPNRLRVETTTDSEHRISFFDGKNFTIFGLNTNYYATVPAPPTIVELIDNVNKKYGIELPLVDLFQWGNNPDLVKRIKSGIDVGPTSVDGITCEQYAFHQEQVDWQIWIQLGDYPLPRKLVIQTLTDDARPQYREKLVWNLAPSYSDDAFTFDPPPNAQRIKIEEVKPDATNK
ncbi:MAG TPA: DUF2092 domain-containing protein [Edaphobacter sp.]|jgi:hypothetical protein|nr:DUF2092 domain-containing protein [Edaphobacter sp.]